MTSIGIGWRPEIDLTVEDLPGIEFVEVIAEGIRPDRLPESLRVLRQRGVPVIPHGVGLSLGGAQRPDAARVAHLADCARALDAPLVSEHIAFVRAGDHEAGHLLPVPRTRESLEVVVANVRAVQATLDVPLALENIAALFAWPEDELTEAQFIGEVLARTGALLLLDVANLFSSGVNFAADPLSALDQLPLDRIGYVHVAGGVERDGVWHDTHTHPVTEPILVVLRELVSRTTPPGVLLERDGDYPSTVELAAELADIRVAVGRRAADEAVRTGLALPGSVPVLPETEPTADTRARLADAQTRLAAVFAGTAQVPPDFDDERLKTQRAALIHKRANTVTWHAPDVAAALGDALNELFEQYAAANPKPEGGSANDVASFVDYLRAISVLRGSRRRPRLRRPS
jgi:uncharacterized protein (UPF0276 family)